MGVADSGEWGEKKNGEESESGKDKNNIYEKIVRDVVRRVHKVKRGNGSFSLNKLVRS